MNSPAPLASGGCPEPLLHIDKLLRIGLMVPSEQPQVNVEVAAPLTSRRTVLSYACSYYDTPDVLCPPQVPVILVLALAPVAQVVTGLGPRSGTACRSEV